MRRKKRPRSQAPPPSESDDACQSRYESAWDESEGYGPGATNESALVRKGVRSDRRKSTPWNTVRRFSNTRSGRVIMAAPLLGIVGAWLVVRRRRQEGQ